MKGLVVSWNHLKANDLAWLKRAVYYGDGFFETIRWQHHQPLFWQHHVHRMEHTARALSLPLPCSADALLPELQKHLLPGIPHQRLRLSFIRTGEGYYTPQQHGLLMVSECTPLPETGYAWHNNPCEAGISSVVKLRHPLSTLKLLSAATYVSAALEARQQGWHEAILLNEAGHVCEAISHNLFVVKQGTVSTPPLSEGCLQGVMRTQVLQLCNDLDLPVQERSISKTELEEAEEIFLTNVITGIRPVTQFHHRTLKQELTVKLVAALQQTCCE